MYIFSHVYIYIMLPNTILAKEFHGTHALGQGPANFALCLGGPCPHTITTTQLQTHSTEACKPHLQHLGFKNAPDLFWDITGGCL